MKTLIILFGLFFSLLSFSQYGSIIKIGGDALTDALNEAETSDKDIYIDAVDGNDNSGNGTSGNPYATLLKGIQVLKPVILNCDITFYLDSGNYNISDDFVKEFNKFRLILGRIFIYGNHSHPLVESISFAYNSANGYFNYTATKAGLTVTENEYQGKWVERTTLSEFYPIAWHAAGTDNFAIHYVRNNRTQPTQIVELGATLTNTTGDENFMDFEPQSYVSGLIGIEKVNINAGGASNDIVLDAGQLFKAYRYCNFECRSFFINSSSLSKNIALTISESMVTSTASSSYQMYWEKSSGYNTRFRRFYVDATEATTAGIRTKFSEFMQIVGMYMYGSGSNIAIDYDDFGTLINNTDYVTFNNFTSVFDGVSGSYVTGEDLDKTELFNCTNLFHSQFDYSSYFYIPDIFEGDAYNLLNGGNLNFINPRKNVILDIAGTYPEIENNLSETLTDNSTTNFYVGDSVYNKSIVIDYTAERTGSGIESNTVVINNKLTTLAVGEKTLVGDDVGISFAVAYDSGLIQLQATTTSTGNNVDFKYKVNRINY